MLHTSVRARWALAAALFAPIPTACQSAECVDGEASCSDDGTTLTRCEAGKPITVDCMRSLGQLCERGSCVDPWRYGSPTFGACTDDPLATRERLREKAEIYDAMAARLHIHPDLKWIMGVTLRAKPVTCRSDEAPPCFDPAEPEVPERDATFADVEQWHSGENDGLWSALYLASQAYRFGVTRSSEALETIKLLLEGERTRMRVTGVPGVFTRRYVPPGVAGVACPEDPMAYEPSANKKDNQWVEVRSDGCVWTFEAALGDWKRSTHCGLEEFAGYCWLDNVSKDEYAGHLFGLGAVYKLVDDAEVQTVVKELLGAVGRHLRANDMKLVDWDGRVTEHGRFLPFAVDDFPGFNAAMGLEHVLVSAAATGDPDLRSFYDDCLLQRSGKIDCLRTGLIEIDPFTQFLSSSGMYVGAGACKSNFNNISMHMLSLHHLIWFERDPTVREVVQATLDTDVVRPPNQPRAIIAQNNAFFDFIWASQKRLGPASDGPAFEAVENGVCMLRQFRASQSTPTIMPPARYSPYCKDRFDRDSAEHPRQIAERCPSTFIWWGDPYGLGECAEDKRSLRPPTGYLLPYWMGRFYGFIDETL